MRALECARAFRKFFAAIGARARESQKSARLRVRRCLHFLASFSASSTHKTMRPRTSLLYAAAIRDSRRYRRTASSSHIADEAPLAAHRSSTRSNLAAVSREVLRPNHNLRCHTRHFLCQRLRKNV